MRIVYQGDSDGSELGGGVARQLSGAGNEMRNHGAQQQAGERRADEEHLAVAQLGAGGELEDEGVVDARALPRQHVEPVHVHVQQHHRQRAEHMEHRVHVLVPAPLPVLPRRCQQHHEASHQCQRCAGKNTCRQALTTSINGLHSRSSHYNIRRIHAILQALEPAGAKL